ncbi:MAG: NACHT domain-containing protein, partial [Leptolyngbyaceae cyanobacterium]
MNCPWLWLLAQPSTGNPPQSKAEQLLEWFNSNPLVGWGMAIFAVVAVAVAAVAKLTGNLDNIIGFVGKYRPKKRELTEADRDRLRRDLIDVVLGQVVKRLEDSLHHKIRLDLKRQEERQRVGRRDWSPSAQTLDSDAALQRRYQFQTAERLSLIRTLNRLPSAMFDELMFTLDPPQGQVPGSSAAQGDRSRALLAWVESAEGPGLEKFCEVLELVGIPLPEMAANAVEEQALTNASTHDLLRRDDINGRLLILGEPGTGKTNELLALAKTLLQQAKASADAPIPVIFELSEWSSEPDKTFADWLCEQLQEKYTVPLAVANHWMEHNRLWPLLDGLDELRRVDESETATDEELDRQRQAKQIQCMRSINAFLDLHPATSAVVCCRRQEYEALEARGEYLKRLNGAITLQALDDEQICTYFENSNRGPLWDTLKNQPELLALARSPLFLLMLVVAYQGQPIHNPNKLLDLYIDIQLNDQNNRGAYPPDKAPSQEQTEHYLAWLATKLEQQELTEFLIERLQPSWL